MQKVIDITPTATRIMDTLRRWGKSYLECAEIYGNAIIGAKTAGLY